jgi:hypothetical protein
MLDLIIRVLIGTILTEAIVEIVSKAGIFSFIRGFLKNKLNFIYEMIICPFCFSVWAGCFVAIVLGVRIPVDFKLGIIGLFVSYFFGGLLLHKLSNFLHDARDRLYYNYDKPLEEEEKADDTESIIGFK